MPDILAANDPLNIAPVDVTFLKDTYPWWRQSVKELHDQYSNEVDL